jgi:hypothetical protein
MNRPGSLAGNLNLRESIALATRLGVAVQPRHGTGELVFRLPGRPPMLVNSRRKDTPLALMSALRRLVNQ